MSFLTTKTSQKIVVTLANILFLSGLVPFSAKPVGAETSLACENVKTDLRKLSNNALIRYQNQKAGNEYGQISNLTTTSVKLLNEANLPLKLVALGIEDLDGQAVNGLGAIALDLTELFKQQGLDKSAAQKASLTAIAIWTGLPAKTTSVEVVEEIKQAVAKQIKDPSRENAILKLQGNRLLTILAGFGKLNLSSLGLAKDQQQIALKTKLEPESKRNFDQQILASTETTAAKLNSSEKKVLLAAQKRYQQELDNLRGGKQIAVNPGSKVVFKFRLDNQQNQVAKIKLPNAEAIAKGGLTGAGKITKVTYTLPQKKGNITKVSELVAIPAKTSLKLSIELEVGAISDSQISSISIALSPTCGFPVTQALNILPPIKTQLIDPLGRVTGCQGELLPDYQGFSVALYDPDPSDIMGSTLQKFTELTETELPDNPDNSIPKGIKPNIQNSNPFFLVDTDKGQYSFLFDKKRSQLNQGATYILVVQPPDKSKYAERRIKLTIGTRQGNVVNYTATSIDGKPISSSDGKTSIAGEILIVEDAERVGLDLAVLDLATNSCNAQEIEITKTGDRALAQPGDIVLYRIAVRNLASSAVENLQISDTLPPGFQLEPNSVHGEKNKQKIDVEVTQSDRQIKFTTDIRLDQDEVINLVYAAQVTPDALRGSGRNSAIVNATKRRGGGSIQDGPAIHTLKIEPGIIEDAGTLIGRVFVDKNFDGEQQKGEPGIPNAVIYLEDGNRVITDPEGLFSVINVLPGVHTGTLDLTSVEGYRLAPNLRFIERNSNSRLVQLEPGGMVRMNFGVTPTARDKNSNEVRSQKSEVRSQKSEVRSQKSEVRSQKAQ